MFGIRLRMVGEVLFAMKVGVYPKGLLLFISKESKIIFQCGSNLSYYLQEVAQPPEFSSAVFR